MTDEIYVRNGKEKKKMSQKHGREIKIANYYIDSFPLTAGK